MIADTPTGGGVPYQVALSQYDHAAAYLALPDDLRAYLRLPTRELQVNLPVPMDDGTLRVFSGYRVQHNSALGPATGGVCYAPHLDIDALRALAMWSTWQSALVDVPYGGAKGSVICDPRALSPGELERLTRHFASATGGLLTAHSDNPAPGFSTSAQTTAWITETVSRIAGRPLSSGAVDHRAAAGCGAVICMDEALRRLGASHPAQVRVAIQGLGSVGTGAARAARQLGYRVIALSDRDSGWSDPRGLDVDTVLAHAGPARRTRSQSPHAAPITDADLLTLDADVVLLCGRNTPISATAAGQVRARLIVEGVSGPLTPAAEAILVARGVTIVPDLLANAGGVLAAYFAWVQRLQSYAWAADDLQRQIRRALVRAADAICQAQQRFGVDPRTAAHIVAIRRVAAACLAPGATL